MDAEIFDAIKNDNIDILRQILDSNNNEWNLNVRDEEGHTPLLCACLKHNHEIIQLLIAKGADVNAINDRVPDWCSEYNAINCAIFTNDTILLRMLVTHPDIDKSKEIICPSHFETTSLAYSYGMKFDDACLYNTIGIGGDYGTVKVLVDIGCDVNFSCSYGNALHAACAFNPDVSIIQLLVDSGIDTELVDATNKKAIDLLDPQKLSERVINNIKAIINHEKRVRHIDRTPSIMTDEEFKNMFHLG